MLLSAALVSLLRVHPALSDHVGYLGYVPKLVAAMAYEGRRESMASGQATSGSQAEPSEHDNSGQPEANVQTPQERVRLSCLRVLHQLASSTTCAEAMAATSAGTPQVSNYLTSLYFNNSFWVMHVLSFEQCFFLVLLMQQGDCFCDLTFF